MSSSPHSSWRARAPRYWGRSVWDALFLLAADYPHARDCDDDEPYVGAEARRKSWKRFLKALPGVLTCGVCAYHFERYIKRGGDEALNEALTDRDTLFRWLHRAKSEVNQRNRTPNLSLEATKRRYIPPCTCQEVHAFQRKPSPRRR